MKVAYISHHKRPNYEYNWFAAMPVETVKFITTDEPPKHEPNPKIQHCQVRAEEMGWENRFFASTARRVFYRDFEKYLEDVDVVVVLEVFSSLSRQFVAYCRKIHKPVVVLVYELIDTHPIYKIPRYRGNTRYCLQHADHFVAISHAAALHLKKLGADETKISVVYPGINLDIFKPDNGPRNNHALMFLGKLGPHKGIDLMIDLYQQLKNKVPRLGLKIIGAGAWKPQVESLAKQDPEVEYHEYRPNAEVPQVYNRCGVYVLPARETKRFGLRIGAEQFCFSAVEAMACGLAVVTTDVGALKEIVTDKNIVCRQDDSAALFRETLALLQDDARLKALSAYNQELVRKRYDIRKQAAQFAKKLEEIVKHGAVKR